MALDKVIKWMIQRAMKNNPNPTVYISNLSYKRDKIGIKGMCIPYGSVKNVKVILDPKTNNPRGMAFVEMGNVEEAMSLINGLNGQEIDGRTVKANFATPQADPERKFYLTPKKDEKKPMSTKPSEFKVRILSKKKKNDERRDARSGFQFKAKQGK